jgi:hypothetical protein
MDDYKPEAFDPATSAWTYWPKPINATRNRFFGRNVFLGFFLSLTD